MRIAYQHFNFRPSSLRLIQQAGAILTEYHQRGIVVTLRQLYYQFVARDIIPNKQSEYKRLGSVINDARLAGLIDWDYLHDRTRNLNKLASWNSPAGVIASAAASYHRNLWEGQYYYVEVWVEKDALLSVIENVCEQWDVPFFACRGYTSQSEMWAAGQRIAKHVNTDRKVRIIHLGDHDPSGVDMTRDVQDRLLKFLLTDIAIDRADAVARGEEESKPEWAARVADATYEKLNSADWLSVDRIALNMGQIRQYNPPPNPAKKTDSRAGAYIAEHGNKSWELDALDPDVLIQLIDESIRGYLDEDLWESMQNRQESERLVLNKTSENWQAVSTFVEGL